MAWAFVDVDDEDLGNQLITHIHLIVMDGIPLAAEWSTYSRHGIWDHATRVTNATHPHLWLFCLRDKGLVLVHNHVNNVDTPPHPTQTLTMSL